MPYSASSPGNTCKPEWMWNQCGALHPEKHQHDFHDLCEGLSSYCESTLDSFVPFSFIVAGINTPTVIKIPFRIIGYYAVIADYTVPVKE